jgi:hypothetical protein
MEPARISKMILDLRVKLMMDRRTSTFGAKEEE